MYVVERTPVRPPRPSTVVIVLIVVTAVCAVLAAVADRYGLPFYQWAVLQPDAFWRGQIWRPITWMFVEDSPIGLALRLVLLYWLGGDLAAAWGDRRFLYRYFLFGAAAGVATCLLALALPPLGREAWLGGWPLIEALTIAWATIYPDRDLYIFLILPLRGRRLIALVIGLTVVTGLFLGFASVVPHLAAEALALVDAGGWWPRDVVRRIQRWRLRRRGPRLYVVEKDEAPPDKGDPPRWLN